MRGKRKIILSLALVLALVIQLFAGLGSVVQAETITPLTITGRFTQFDAASPVQIGVSFSGGTIVGGGNWPNGFLHSGNIKLNGEPQNTDKWRFQATGTSTINVVCFDYTPVTGHIITIPAGTQIRCNGNLYEFTNAFSMEYNGTTWVEVKVPDVSFAITQSNGYRIPGAGSTPEQIGFSVNGTIAGGGNWPSGTFTKGIVTLNDAPKSNWTMQATATNAFNLVCWDYIPVAEDVIKIPAGLQFTCNNKLYEVTNAFTIQYNGAAWLEVKAPDVSFAVTGRFTQFDAASPVQIGISVDGNIEGGGNWPDGILYSGQLKLNGTDKNPSDWKFQATGTNTMNVVCLDGYVPIEGDVITIPAGIQFTCANKLYEITNEYKMEYDGTTWIPYVPTTPLTLGEILSNSGTANHPSDADRMLYRVYVSTGQTGTAPWTGGDDNVKVYVNGTEEVNCSFVWADNPGELLIQLDVENTRNIESITVKKGTEATINGALYEVQNDDYTVYYYDGSFHAEPKPAPTEPKSIAITERYEQFDASAAGTTPEQIGFRVDKTIEGGENWFDCVITSGEVLLNDSAKAGWKIQTTGTNTFNLVCWNYTPVAGDIIKFSAGTQFTGNGAVYELANDYAIKYDGTKWGTFVKADEFITITGRHKDFDVSAKGETPEQIGFAVEETIDGGDLWFDCKVTYGSILLNGVAQGEWKIQTTGTNNFNLVCWYYTSVEGDVITIPAGTQFTGNGVVYEVSKDVSIIYHNGEWVLDKVAIAYRGEELVNGTQYGLRIGNTKKAIEELFTATDGIGRNLNITFTYPSEMYDANDKFLAGTYQMKVSATSASGITKEYNITVKGFTKDAPTICYEGESKLVVDAGKALDTSILNAVAKDGNGKALELQYKYSAGALNSAGELNKGEHILYLMTVDDEGQTFSRKIELTCYEMTDIVIKGFYLQMEEQLFIATNMKNPERFKDCGMISTDDVLINGKSDVITWITIDSVSGSLYMIIEPEKGDVLTIDGGTTFLDKENYIGFRTLNSFKGHTDGIGWIKDRLPNNGFGTSAYPNSSGSSTSPVTGDVTPWAVYVGLCILLVPVIAVLYRKRRLDYEK